MFFSRYTNSPQRNIQSPANQQANRLITQNWSKLWNFHHIVHNCKTFKLSFTIVRLSQNFLFIFVKNILKTYLKDSTFDTIKQNHSVFCRIQLLTLSECKQWSKFFSVLDIYMFFQNRSSHFWCFTSTSSSKGFLLDGRKSGWISSSWRLNVQPNKL